MKESIGSDLIISKRNLPHWQLGGSTYFVTFRIRQGIILSPEERSMVLRLAYMEIPERAKLHVKVEQAGVPVPPIGNSMLP